MLRPRTATTDREALFSGLKGCERVTAGKKYKSATAFLIPMQSDNGANPDGWANEQPLKKQGAADAIRLE